MIALFGFLAVRGLGGDRSSSPVSSATAPQDGIGFSPSAAPARTDLSQLSPEESADRLYNRVMLLASEEKRDSVAFFAPMAIQAYQMIGRLNDDQHYDVGRVATVAGNPRLAKAHADTILARSPTHLLGLLLAAHAAELQGDAAAAARYRQRLLAAEETEMARQLPEYDRHREEIVAALAAARGRGR
ncbi:hypothetical protein BH23GEM2_BH23GEM2_16760 [soil metagenome]